jgi:hypothetical protein
MKNLFLVTILACATILSSCGGSLVDEKTSDSTNEVKPEIEEEEDELYISEDGQFSINFLGGNPSDMESLVPTEVGDIEIHMFLYEKSVTEALMVAYSDYPSAMIEASNSAKLLEGARNGALEKMGIPVAESEEEIEIDGHPGLFFTGNNGQFYVTYEVYLVGSRLYQVAILRDGSYASDKDISGFNGSFKLTNQDVEEGEEG